jgi:hypothetical protein
VPDLNFTLDPVALEVLLKQSRSPATFSLFEVTSTVNLTAADLAPLADASGAYYAAASGRPRRFAAVVALALRAACPVGHAGRRDGAVVTSAPLLRRFARVPSR